MAGFDPTLQPSDDRGHLLTEQSNPRSRRLDQLVTKDLVNLFVEEDRRPQEAVAGASEALAAAVDAISERLLAGGRLFYLGAGTSGRLGVLDAAECPPTFCSDPELVQGVLAGGPPALLHSSEGLEDLEQAGRDDLDRHGFRHAHTARHSQKRRVPGGKLWLTAQGLMTRQKFCRAA